MRFLFGLLFGALATLFVATAFDAPVDGLQKKVLAAWGEVKSMANTNRAEPEPMQEADDFAALPENPYGHAEPQADLLAQASMPDENQWVTPISPEPETAAIEEKPEATADKAITESHLITEEVAATLSEVDSATQEAETESFIDDVVPTQIPPEEDFDLAGEGVVWSPFHSEASAEGFARRLSDQIEHDFDVRKQGPAQYLVVYNYASESERANIESQIALATGQR